jgi:hypothetical protein
VLSVLGEIPTTERYYEAYELGWSLEIPLLVAATVLTIVGFWRVFPLSTHALFARWPNPGLGVVRASILFAPVWFWFVLQTGAASDIVGFYTLLYVMLAMATLLIAGLAYPAGGVFLPADVVERGNLAAGLTLAGFALGTAFAFGGALTGEGPGWWVVLVFFFLAYWELRGTMALVARLGSLRDEVRIERDASAGILLGGVAVAAGLVSGRAAAGDFTGWENDIPDYLRRLAPLGVVPLVAALVAAYTRHSGRKASLRAATAGLLVLGGFLYYFLT